MISRHCRELQFFSRNHKTTNSIELKCNQRQESTHKPSKRSLRLRAHIYSRHFRFRRNKIRSEWQPTHLRKLHLENPKPEIPTEARWRTPTPICFAVMARFWDCGCIDSICGRVSTCWIGKNASLSTWWGGSPWLFRFFTSTSFGKDLWRDSEKAWSRRNIANKTEWQLYVLSTEKHRFGGLSWNGDCRLFQSSIQQFAKTTKARHTNFHSKLRNLLKTTLNNRPLPSLPQRIAGHF